MKVHETEWHTFIIERSDGYKMELSPVEYSQLYQIIIRNAVWSEVMVHLPDTQEEDFDFDLFDVMRCKEDIIDDLLPDFQDISEDRVWQTLDRFCDRIDPNEEAPY